MDYIAHHGILGQKWGVRRFQNEDGTLTEAGKERLLQKAEALEYKRKAKELMSGRFRVTNPSIAKIKKDPLYKIASKDPKIKAAYDEMENLYNDPEIAEIHERFMNDHEFHERKAREWSKGNPSAYDYYAHVRGIDAHDDLLYEWRKEHPAEDKMFDESEARLKKATIKFGKVLVDSIKFEDLQYYYADEQLEMGQALLKEAITRDLDTEYYHLKR